MVVIPLAAMVVFNLAHGKKTILKFIAAVVGLALLVMPLASPLGVHNFGGHIKENLESSYETGIVYRLGLHNKALIFTLALIAFLVITSYTQAYKNLSGPYMGFMVLGVGATSATLLADDFFNFYVFMEIALISQTALALAQASVEAYKSAVKYLMVANIAGNCLLLGVGLLLSIAGSVNISDIHRFVLSNAEHLKSNPVYLAAAALIVFAWLYASGVFPFHNIKSELYGSAKPHSAALMQTQTKFIMIALALVILKIFYPVWGVRPIMLAMACGAMIFGVIMALKQNNYKRMLSYHAISQAGYVAAGLAIGTQAGIIAGIFHAINHVIYKTALFLGAEIVMHRNKTTDFKSLGAAFYSIPFVGVLVLCAKFAISGIPPFNGFQSKLMLITAAFQANMPEISVIMILVSVMTFISMMKAFHLIYLRPLPEDVESQQLDKPVGVYVGALVLLVFLCILLGVYPQAATRYIQQIAVQVGTVWV